VDKIPEARIQRLKDKMNGSHTLWLEDDIVKLLQDKYDPKVLAAYQSLVPLAYKADLARYCIIHSFGGWYVDLFVTINDLKTLDNFEQDTEAIIFREMLVPPGGSLLSILNTIFWFKSPGHEVLANLIDSVVDNVLNNRYGAHPFSITGSMVFGKEVALYELKNPSMPFLVGECSMVDGTPTHQISSVLDHNPFVISTRRKIEEDISSEVPTGYEVHPNNYYRMWFNRSVFQ
jgi:hypothetical protein